MAYVIKQTNSLHAIHEMFVKYNRADQFSFEALGYIMDFLEDTTEDGIIDFDVIGICCDFTEAHWEDIKGDYDLEGETIEEVVAELGDNTWVSVLSNGNLLYMNW